MKMIITSECLQCEYGTECIDNKHKVHCGYRHKDYIYGQRIPCEDKKERTGDQYEESYTI